jgi:hypothetical protein
MRRQAENLRWLGTFAGAAALVAALLSGGCFRTEAAQRRAVVIRSSFWGAIEDIHVWEEQARRFNRRQNRIRVKLEHIAGQNY